MRRKILSLLLSVTLVYTSADFSVFALEKSVEAEESVVGEDDTETYDEAESEIEDSKEEIEDDICENDTAEEKIDEENTDVQSEKTDSEIESYEENSDEEVTENEMDEEKGAEEENENEVDIDEDIVANGTVIASGKCGENLTWSLTEDTLTISGTGDMWDYNNNMNQWHSYCSSIDKKIQLVMSDKITSIGNNAFYYCRGLKVDNLEIPDSVTNIGSYAFYACDGFTGDLIIPKSVKKIEEAAFSGCSGFNGELILNEGLETIGDAAFYSCGKFIGNLKIPNGVKSIGNNAFQHCDGFTGSLIIPDGVTNMGKYAFAMCSGFSRDLIIPGSIKNIDSCAFFNCRGFKGELILKEGIEKIGDSAFYSCGGFKGDLIIPNSVLEVSKGAFENCQGFDGKLVIGKNVKIIETRAFYDCKKLIGDLIIPEGVTNIGNDAFMFCSSLNGKLKLPDSLKIIGGSAFYDCKKLIGDLTIPEGVTSIGDCAFLNCSGLTGDLKLPKGLVKIGGVAFCGCSRLTGDLVIPKGIEVLYYEVFKDCINLSGKVYIPKEVKDIYDNTFTNIPNLIIYGEKGSFAETYAVKNGIPFREYTFEEEVVYYTISYVTNCDISIPSIKCLKGNKTTAPVLQVEGKTLIGWYTDIKFINKFDFNNTVVTSDLTLYAKWKDTKEDNPKEDDPDETQKEKKLVIADIPNHAYTGDNIKPEIKVYFTSNDMSDKDMLVLGKDYTVQYRNNKNPGTATAIIKMKGNHAGTYSKNFNILQRDLSDSQICISNIALIYNKKMQRKSPIITLNTSAKSIKLKENKDYIVDYGMGTFTEIGRYEVNITGKSNFKGTVKGYVNIVDKSKSINSAKITLSANKFVFDGTEKKPQVTVTLNGVVPSYDVKYINNINVGKATVVITGAGDYAGTKSVNFSITKGNVASATVAVEDTEYVKGGCTPNPIVKYSGKTLLKDVDYIVSYKNNKKIGTATATIKGKGKYTGSISASFRINTKDLKKIDCRAADIIYKNGKNNYLSKPILTDVNGNLLESADYSIVSYTCNGVVLDKNSKVLDGDNITITVTGKNNYIGTTTATYVVKQAQNINKAKVTVRQKIYTGNKIKLEKDDILVTMQGAAVVYGQDYEIIESSYKNNINKGTAEVTLRGKGRYAGEKKIKFKIVERQ